MSIVYENPTGVYCNIYHFSSSLNVSEKQSATSFESHLAMRAMEQADNDIYPAARIVQ